MHACGLEVNKSRTEDSKFDIPLNELLEAKMIRKVGKKKIRRYRIYEITSKGEHALHSLKNAHLE